MRKILLCLLATAAVAFAQENPPKAATPPPDNPYSTFNKFAYKRLKDILLRSAEKMPEADYSFKPADSVRTYGQIIGHVADAQYIFCSKALGETNPAPNVEKTKISKADLIAALKDAFAYCDKAYDGMTDASGTQMVPLFGPNPAPKMGVLEVNNMHNMEHYGNLVTYMRIKNIVPPSSEQPPPPPPQEPPKK